MPGQLSTTRPLGEAIQTGFRGASFFQVANAIKSSAAPAARASVESSLQVRSQTKA